MARHRIPRERRGHKALMAAAAAAGISTTMVLGHASDTASVSAGVELAASTTAIGVGGRDDPLAERIEAKLSGNYAVGVVPDDYKAVEYPANLNFQSSQTAGIPNLLLLVDTAPDGNIRIVSYSEGTLVAEEVKRQLAAEGYEPEGGDLTFVFMASPYLPNGGIFARFPGFRIPGLLPEFSAAQPTQYDSTYIINEYDGFTDFPAYFNVLSIANAVAGMAYAHPDRYYEAIDLEDEDSYIKTVVTDNGPDGTDTYYFVRAEHLPLLAPVRQVAGIIGLTPLTEPVLAAIEPLLRLAIDAGYTDRENLNPDKPTAFSLITPPAKIVEAIAGIPGALAEGAGNLTSGGSSGSSLTAPTTESERKAAVDESVVGIAEKPLEAPVKEAPKDPVPDASKPPAKPTDSAASTATATTVRKPIKTPVKDVLTEVARHITRPTMTSFGNKAVPGTVGGTPTGAGSSTKPPVEDDNSTLGVDAGTPGSAPAGGTTGGSPAGGPGAGNGPGADPSKAPAAA